MPSRGERKPRINDSRWEVRGERSPLDLLQATWLKVMLPPQANEIGPQVVTISAGDQATSVNGCHVYRGNSDPYWVTTADIIAVILPTADDAAAAAVDSSAQALAAASHAPAAFHQDMLPPPGTRARKSARVVPPGASAPAPAASLAASSSTGAAPVADAGGGTGGVDVVGGGTGGGGEGGEGEEEESEAEEEAEEEAAEAEEVATAADGRPAADEDEGGAAEADHDDVPLGSPKPGELSVLLLSSHTRTHRCSESAWSHVWGARVGRMSGEHVSHGEVHSRHKCTCL